MLYPISNNKHRIKMRPDTVLESFPLYCPKCKQGAIINVKVYVTSVIKEHGEQP